MKFMSCFDFHETGSAKPFRTVEPLAGDLSGRPFQSALREVMDHFERDLTPSALARAVADGGPVALADLPTAAVDLLSRHGLAVHAVAESGLARAVSEQQVLLGLGLDVHVVVTHKSRRQVRVMLKSTDDGEMYRAVISRGRLGRWLADKTSDCVFLGVSGRSDLTPMARPGGKLAPWRRLRALVRLERADITVVALYAATAGALTLITPIGTQALVNTIAFGTLLQPLIVLTAALLIGLALAGSISALQAYVVEVLQRRILVRVAEDLGQRLPRVAAQARDRKDLVELNNRFLDVITIQKSAAELLLTGLSLVLQIAAGMFLLGFYHPMLLVFDLLIVVALMLVVQLGRGGTASAMVESRAKFDIAAWLDELARAPERFAGSHGRVVAAEELAQRAHAYVRARRSHFRKVFSVLIGGVALQVLSVVALLGIGGWLVIERQLSLGQLVAAEIVISAIAVGVGKLGRLADKTFDLVAATDKLGKLLDLPLHTDGTDGLADNSRGISLCARDLRVGYGTDAVAASGVSFAVESGQKVLLDGPPGSGRSAVLEVLAGWRRPMAGGLRWDGLSRPRVDDTSAHTMLVRTGEISAGSVYTNLRLADAELSSAEAWAALAAVGLDEVIDALPGGLDCQLLPSGAPLSPSQCKRLALARALIGKPRLLLIDETLDSLAQQGDDDIELALLCELLLGSATPWTAVVATRSSVVRSYLGQTLTLPGREKNGPGKADQASKEDRS